MKKEVLCYCNSRYTYEETADTQIVRPEFVPILARLFGKYGYSGECNCFFYSMGSVLTRMMRPRKNEDGTVNVIWEI